MTVNQTLTKPILVILIYKNIDSKKLVLTLNVYLAPGAKPSITTEFVEVVLGVIFGYGGSTAIVTLNPSACRLYSHFKLMLWFVMDVTFNRFILSTSVSPSNTRVFISDRLLSKCLL